MGMQPLLSGVKSEDEGLFVRQHAYWAQAMQKAIDSERAKLIATDAEDVA